MTPRPKPLVAIALGALLVGAAIGLADHGPSAAPADGGQSIPVEGGQLPVDQRQSFDRVESLYGADVAPPSGIVVEPADEMRFPATGGSPFFEAFGLTVSPGTTPPRAYLADGGTIYLNRRLLNGSAEAEAEAEVETTLVHEYVHLIQYRRGEPGTIAAGVAGDPQVDYDGGKAGHAIYEGAAVYVTRAYWEQYGAAADPAASTVTSYRSASGLRQYVLASHRWGYRYVRARADSSESLPSVYRNPPRTTEELLHARPPGSEPIAQLSVAVDTDRWTEAGNRTRMGELFLRVALAQSLNRSQAAAGADGWGEDTRITLEQSDGTRGYVWALRWDDTANATEAKRALERSLTNRGRRLDTGWQVGDTRFSVTRTDERTLVVLVGPKEFTREVAAAGSGHRVRVTDVDPTS